MADFTVDTIDGYGKFRKRMMRTLRFLLLLAVVGSAYPKGEAGDLDWKFWLAGGLLFASNIAYHFDRAEIFQKFRLSAILFLFDTAVLAFMMFEMGERSNEFFILFALTILMGAISRSLQGAVVSTLAVGSLYTLLTLYGKTGVLFLSMAFLTRLALLFVLSIFVGYLAFEADQARRSARLSSDLYRGLFEMNPAYVFLCDGKGRILHVNRTVEGGLGLTADELRGRPLWEAAEVTAAWRAMLGAPSPQRKVESFSLGLRRRDGTALASRATVTVFPAPGGAIQLVQAHEKSGELTIMRRAVVRAEKQAAVGQLVAVVVHELNNMLTSVVGYSQLLASRSRDPDALSEIALIEKEAVLASRIVRNLLIFSRKQEAVRTRFSLNEVATSVLELKAYELRPRRITVAWQPDPEIPDLVGDPHQVGLVVLYLLNNAQQAVEKGRRENGLIRVTTWREGDFAMLDVADNGPGIAIEERPFLFETHVPGRDGDSGLGLSVCRSVIQAHGGDVTVDSQPGTGATFRVRLPGAPPQDAVVGVLAEPAAMRL